MEDKSTADQIKLFRRSMLGLAGASLAGCIGDGGPGGTETSPVGTDRPSETPKPLPEDGATIVLSPEGSADGAGTADDPVDSLETARDMAREKVESVDSDTLAIALREGTYQRTKSFRLGKDDSGTENTTIEYRSYPGETATITGGAAISLDDGEPVSGSVAQRIPESARDSVLAFDLEAAGIEEMPDRSIRGFGIDSSPATQVFVGDEPMTVARWPNEGDERVKTASRYFKQGQYFEYDHERPEQWDSVDGVFVWGMWRFEWAPSTMELKSINPDQNQLVTYQEKSGNWGMVPGAEYYYFNVLEELDQPGEYFIDQDSLTLYLYPPTDADGDVYIPTLSTPLISAGNPATAGFDTSKTTTPDSGETSGKPTNITFRNLTLENARWHGAAIKGDRISFDACTIKKLGGKAITFDGMKNRADGCDIDATGIGGISLKGGERKTLTKSESVVRNCDISRHSMVEATYTPGIGCGGIGQHITNNRIHDVPHMALGLNGNEHLIEYNHIHHAVQDSTDAGAIYTGRHWEMRGNVLRYNLIHNVHSGGDKDEVGIYFDDQWSGVTIHGNILYNIDMGIMLGGGRSNTVTNNLFVYNNTSIQIDQRGAPGEWRHSQCSSGKALKPRLKNAPIDAPAWKEAYPELQDLLADEPCLPKYNRMVRNAMFHCPRTNIGPLVHQYGTIEDNLDTSESLGFAESEGFTASFSDDSMVTQEFPEWEPLPLEKMGLREDRSLPTRQSVTPAADIVSPSVGLALTLDERVISTGSTTSISVSKQRFDGQTSPVASENITYSVDNGEVLSVSEDGTISAESTGTATITIVAEADGLSLETTRTVRVLDEPMSLADPWQLSNYGENTIGYADGDSNSMTVASNGRNIWQSSDMATFVYQETTAGNVTVTATVEDFQSEEGSPHKSAAVGVMLRDSDDPGAANVNLRVTPSGGTLLTWRSNDGAGTEYTGGGPDVSGFPTRVRLKRTGTSVTAQAHADGTWQDIATKEINLVGPALAGISLYAHNKSLGSMSAGPLDIAQLSNMSVTESGGPAPPGSVKLSRLEGGDVEIKWDGFDGVEGYNVYRSTTEESGYRKVNTDPITETEFVDTSAGANKDYFYAVTAINADGEESVRTSPASIDTNPEPKGVTARKQDASTVTVNWSPPPSGGESYNVYRSPDKSNWSKLTDSPVTERTFTDSEYDNTEMYYGVSAIAEDGSESGKATGYVGTGGTLGSYQTYKSTPTTFSKDGSKITIEATGRPYNTRDWGAVYKEKALGPSGTVTVKVTDVSYSHFFARAGILIQNDIEKPGDSHGGARVCVQVPDDWQSTNDYLIRWDKNGDGRLSFNYDDGEFKSQGTASFPSWLKLERDGNSLKGYYKQSADAEWTEINPGADFKLTNANDKLDVGIYHNGGSSEPGKAVFENFTIE